VAYSERLWAKPLDTVIGTTPCNTVPAARSASGNGSFTTVCAPSSLLPHLRRAHSPVKPKLHALEFLSLVLGGDSLAALAYDAAKVLADAIKRAGGAGDSAKLKDAINATKDFAGVTGSITLDSNRNAVKPAVVLELTPSASKFTYKETIYPEGMTPPTSTATTANTNAMPNTAAMNSNSNAMPTNSAATNSTTNTNTAAANANK